MDSFGTEKVVVLDQGSRPGPALVSPSDQDEGKRVLIIDHHMSDAVSNPIHPTQVLTPVVVAARLASLDSLQHVTDRYSCPSHLCNAARSSSQSTDRGELACGSRGHWRWGLPRTGWRVTDSARFGSVRG